MKLAFAVIPGDGIGKEVVPEGTRVLEAADDRFGIQFDWTWLDWGSVLYTIEGYFQPQDGLAPIRSNDAILSGAVGWPMVRDEVSLWELLIPIRREFQRYADMRPVCPVPGAPCPLAGRSPGDVDFGSTVCSTIGIAPSANLNPKRDFPSMFEPVHGPAPDIADKGISHPIGQTWSAAMMPDHFSHSDAARAIETAMGAVLQQLDRLTQYIGGKASTTRLKKAIADEITRAAG